MAMVVTECPFGGEALLFTVHTFWTTCCHSQHICKDLGFCNIPFQCPLFATFSAFAHVMTTHTSQSTTQHYTLNTVFLDVSRTQYVPVASISSRHRQTHDLGQPTIIHDFVRNRKIHSSEQAASLWQNMSKSQQGKQS